MGNNASSSRPPSSEKFFCVNKKSVSSTNFNTHSLKESAFRYPTPAYSSGASGLSLADSCQLISNTSSETSKDELSLSNQNVLEACRIKKQLLRDQFFSSESSSISHSPLTSTPDESDMNSNRSSKLNSPVGFPQGFANKPGKVRRTFQYRPPSATAPVTPVDKNLNELPKLYSTSSSMVGNEVSPFPRTNPKLNKLNSVPAFGSSKIPGMKARNNSCSGTSKNMNVSQNVTPTTQTIPSFPEVRSGPEERFKKSATFDGNINGDHRRRESAPPRCLPQRKYNNSSSLSKVHPVITPSGFNQKSTFQNSERKNGSGEEGRRYTLFCTNSKLTPENSGLKKPVESKPFYTIGLYQYKSPRPTSGEFPSTLQNQGLNTGVVTQRKLFYQTKSEDRGEGISPVNPSQKPTTPTPTPLTSQFGLSRSATFVRGKNGEIRPDTESAKHEALMSQSTPLSSQKQEAGSHCVSEKGSYSGNVKASEKETAPVDLGYRKDSLETVKRLSFPLEHANSTTSTSSILGMDGPSGDPNVISDSEFLIDDEISDQPELTLTFKDSPLRLSRSSSGESLLSCDLMLDVSLKDSVCVGETELTSDSAISDVSSSIPTSLGSQSVNSNGHTKSSVLPRRTNRVSSPLCSTPLASKQNSKSGFGFRSTTNPPNSGLQNQVETQKSKTPFKIQERKSLLNSENKTPLTTVNKSPNHSAKSYTRFSSSNRTSLVSRLNESQTQSVNAIGNEKSSPLDRPSQFVINDLCEDVRCLREQLEVLKGVLVEQEIIQAGKDETIHNLRKEIEILRNPRKKISAGNGDGDEAECVNSDLENENQKYRRKDIGDGDGEDSKTINTASQTDSAFKNRDLVHPHELNGRLVSFWIGRRSYSSYNSTITFAT